MDTRTPRNFLMRTERKTLSFLALGRHKANKEQTNQKQLKNSQGIKHNFLVCIDLNRQAKKIILLLG